MIFLFGINTKRENLDFRNINVCQVCGAYGGYEAFVEYNVFSIFFIPIIKWGRKYFLKSTCCGSVFSISEEIGRDIESGIKNSISDEDMTLIYASHKVEKTCGNCGNRVDSSFDYCPKCGSKLNK